MVASCYSHLLSCLPDPGLHLQLVPEMISEQLKEKHANTQRYNISTVCILVVLLLVCKYSSVCLVYYAGIYIMCQWCSVVYKMCYCYCVSMVVYA